MSRLRGELRKLRLKRRGRARDQELLRGLAGRDDLRINVGSGSSHLDGWLNADLERDPEGLCLRMDATEQWPFSTGSATAVNSEHFIEHVSREAARVYIREAFRVLRPGGLIRTSTPDLEGICRVYLEADPGLLDLHREHGYSANRPGDLVNNYVYALDHQQLYDFDMLADMLREAGFEEIERARFGESSHEALRGIDRHEMGALERIVVAVDAVKPGDGPQPGC